MFPTFEHRKLAAIMFTDMVGYSALSQRNEALALELLEEHRRIVRHILPRHGGREVKTTGDGFLIEFPSALAAVQCAVDVQAALHARNLAQPDERQVHIRIGIHVGDVVLRDGDIHGDGVNIAARIEPLAGPGGIAVSRAVQEQVGNKLEAQLVPLGRAELKNITGGLEVFRVVLPWQRGAPKRVPSGWERRWRRVAPWALAAGCAGALLMTWRRPGGGMEPVIGAAPAPLRRFGLALSTPAEASSGQGRLHPALSPDGRLIAYATAAGLWLRRLDSVEPPVQLVAGGDITHPFWSPRSSEVGFFDGTKLMRVPIEGGRPMGLADVPGYNASGGGAAWLDDDQIYVASGGSGLSVVPVRGGALKPVWEIPSGGDIVDLHQPGPLPGGAGVLVVVHRRVAPEATAAGLGVDTLAVCEPSGGHRVIWQDPEAMLSKPVYCPSGHVLFQRNEAEIWALPFSPARLEAAGPAFRVAEGGAKPSASADGALLLTTAFSEYFARRQLVWVDRAGRLQETVGPALPGMLHPRVSGDGRRILVSAGKNLPDQDIWLLDTATGGALPLTRNKVPEYFAQWQKGDRSFLFLRGFASSMQTLSQPVDGAGDEEALFPLFTYPSPGGRYFLTQDDGTNAFISTGNWRYAEAGSTHFTPLPLERMFGRVRGLVFSPDERWLALSSAVSGRQEIWVVDFPGLTTRAMVSRAGGRQPVWHPQGEELFFLSGDQRSLMAARWTPARDGFEAPRKLFDLPPEVFWRVGALPSLDPAHYDVSADGERFLMLRRAEAAGGEDAPARPDALLVQNWFEEFRRKK